MGPSVAKKDAVIGIKSISISNKTAKSLYFVVHKQ